MRLKHACADAGQYGVNVSPDEYRSSGTRMLRTSDLSEDGVSPPHDGIYLTAPIPQHQLLEAGDILVSRSGTIGRSFLVPATAAGDTFAGFLVRFRPSTATDARFLSYVLRSTWAQDQIRAEAVSSTIQNFNADRYANLDVPNPAKADQRRIADFLDDRVARIDQIITARRQQVADLRERWSTEVDDVLDRIQETTRASRLVKVLPGFAFPSADFSLQESDRRLLRGVNVGVGKTRWDEVAYWPENRVEEVRGFLLGNGDVVIGMDRPWIGRGLRIARVTESDGKPLLLQRVAKISSTTVRTSFLFWAYQSRRFRAQVESDLTGLSVPHLSGDQIGSFDLPVCSDQRQVDVVAALEAGSAQMEKGVALLDASISLLQEYKQSLITAAVTGELDVTTAGRTAPPHEPTC